MNCPYCGEEMEKGYIQSRDGLGWNKKKVILNVLSGLIYDKNMGKVIVSYNCEKCQKMVIDYGNKISEE